MSSEIHLSFDASFLLFYQVGIAIAARKYDLDSDSPFQTSDILNLLPVVKHSVPLCSEAKNLIEAGKARLSEVKMTKLTFIAKIFSE